MQRLGLARNLVQLIRDGTLLQRIEEAYADLARLNAVLDAWEAAHPEQARLVPWHEGREAWKAQGRPRPEWYEVLVWFGERAWGAPITTHSVERDLLVSHVKPYRRRLKRKRSDNG